MYCFNCGTEVPDDAAFCYNCGARLKDNNPTPKKNKTGIIVAVVVLVAVLVGGGVVAAQYLLPHETANLAPESATTEAADTTDSAQAAPEPATTTETQTLDTSESIFQVAKILAMDPVDIPSFLTSHGATPHVLTEEEKMWGELTECWDLDSASFANVLGSDSVESVTYDLSRLKIGKNLSALTMECLGWTSSDEVVFTEDMLANGEVPADLVISTNALKKLSGDDLVNFLHACGFTSGNYKTFEYTENYGTGQTASTNEMVAYASAVTVNDRTCYQFAYQMGSEYDTYTYVGCLSEETSKRMYTFEFSREASWDSMDEDTREDWIAKSVVQMMNTGNGSVRTNVVTGETEVLNDDNTAFIPE